jgi:hypothetical protein
MFGVTPSRDNTPTAGSVSHAGAFRGINDGIR